MLVLLLLLLLLLLLQISSSVRNTEEPTGNLFRFGRCDTFVMLVSSSSESGSGLIGSGVGGLIGGGQGGGRGSLQSL